MNRTISRAAAFLILLVCAVSACADDVTDPIPQTESIVTTAASATHHGDGVPSTCSDIDVPVPSRLVQRVYADGVQIYRWNGAEWSFVAPSAQLTAAPDGHGIIGTHYAGPTWESVSGSKVVAAVKERCSPDATAVPWLLLEATAASGSGLFARVTFIQRVNTVGGLAPAAPGSFVGEEARVPYTTEYLFYRAR